MLAGLSMACIGTGAQASARAAWSTETASRPLGSSTAMRAPRLSPLAAIARAKRATRSPKAPQDVPTQASRASSWWR